jgi:BlaI family penicillinase repressor
MNWSKSTVTTMIRRMTEKELITYHTEGRTKVFRAAVSREDVVAQETDSLLERAYRGSIGMMLSAMVSHKNLSKADIDELYAILKEAEEDAK